MKQKIDENQLEKLKKIANKYKFPVKLLVIFYRDGILLFTEQGECDSYSIFFLEKYKLIWRKVRYIKIQLSNISKKERKKIIETCELNPAEQYIYTRLQNEPSIKSKVLFTELQQFFNINAKHAKEIIRRMRIKLKHRKRYEKQKCKTKR